MKGINALRAKFLFDRFKTTQFEINVVSMLKALFISEPSVTRTIDCEDCGLLETTPLTVLELDYVTFDNDISNIGDAIEDNELRSLPCRRCKKAVDLSYSYGQHLFVEVISGSYMQNLTMYEPRVRYKLGDIPVSIFDNQYILVAAFLYFHGASDSDIGHYKVAIKLNEKWELFDDYDPRTKELTNNHAFIIHALMYVKHEDESDSQEENENETETENGNKNPKRNLKRKIKTKPSTPAKKSRKK